jgi:hypothetical protein
LDFSGHLSVEITGLGCREVGSYGGLVLDECVLSNLGVLHHQIFESIRLVSLTLKALCGGGPDANEDQGEEGSIGVSRSQVNPDTPASFSDPSPNFEEFDSEGADLSRLKFSALEMLTHQQEQTVGKGVKQKPELVGEKPMAAEPIGFELKLQFLDTILGITPKDIDFVIDSLRIEAQIGDHKPLIGSLVGVFGLGNHTAGAPPGVSPIPEGPKKPLLPSSLLKLVLSFGQKTSPFFLQPVIGDQTNGVMDTLLLAESIEARHGESRIGPHKDLNSGIGPLELLDDSFEHSH